VSDAVEPIRVAIVGGGCAAMTTAFELTRPEHRGRYAVTVYQVGWRLGGKGASGRGPNGRIEEHGLHLWMGFYENAFRIVRECYAELGRDPGSCPIATWTDAFSPLGSIGVADRGADGRWDVWSASLPPEEGFPGDGFANGERFTAEEYFRRTVRLLRTLFDELLARLGLASADGETSAGAGAPDATDREGLIAFMGRIAEYAELASLAAVVQAIRALETVLGSLGDYPENLVLRFIEAIAGHARQLLERRIDPDPELRRIWQVMDLVLATLRGEVRFGLVTDPRGFDAIDEYDCREWLLLNGASEKSVDCGFLRALYDLGFSYEDGDPSRPRISAGQALRSTVRAFFTYRGAFFWRMNAGMGDVVFAPLYEVLRRRGVRFEFFHRLERVRLADPAALRPGEERHVVALELDVQAHVRGGAAYEPLVDVQGLPCWPSQADYRQLEEGERLLTDGVDFESHWDQRRVATRTLEVGRDFDLVVLGIGLGAVPSVCGELVATNARWRAMVDHVRTVATQAFQVWLAPPLDDLGWRRGPIVVCGFEEPFDTWADMRHLLAAEGRSEARTLAYFCNALPDEGPLPSRRDPAFPEGQRARVRANAIRFLREDLRHLWPSATDRAGGFRWRELVGGDGRASGAAAADERAFDSQFWTANVNPSDRYVLSLPGSSRYRISPLDRTYDNLTIAGDWTDCGLNAGCVEAAVMSGRLAAHSISRRPALEEIIGYDHP
jgi:uncharacterized protein with NAD-binding domain and iron-sulfur cluster